MRRFLFALLALAATSAHADIPDWLRRPASGCQATETIRYLTPGARATCGTITFSELSGKPTTLAGYGITDAQARVTGTCSVGNAIRVIAADGTVTCQSASGGGGTWGSITGTLSNQTDLQTALNALQPLDSDLTAIAALTTTSNGRGFLALADAAAGRTYLSLGSLATSSAALPVTIAQVSHKWLDSYTSGTGLFTASRPACADLSDSSTGCTATLATVATSGAYTDLTGLPTLPANTTSTSHQWFNAYNSTTGAFARTQPACADISDAGTMCTATAASYLTTSSAASTYVPQTTTVNGHALSGNVTVSASDVSLGSVTNDAQTKAAIVPNTAPSAGQVLVGNAGGTAYAPVTLSGSGATASLSSSGVLTLSAIPNATLSNSAVTVAGHSISLGASSAIACVDLSNGATGCSTATGTSGGTIPLLNGTNTWSGAQSFNSSDLILKGATSGTTTLNAAATAGSTTITLPGGTTDFSATGGTSQVVKQTSSGGAFTVARLACADLSDSAAGCSSAGSGITALTGDVTASGTGSVTATLANIPTATPAAGTILHTAITAPSTPAAGNGAVYVDSTSKNIAVKDDAGVVKHGVQTDTGTANNYISGISDAGGIAKSRPTCSTLSDSGTGCSASVSGTNTGDQTKTCASHFWVSTLAATTTSTCTQPAAADLSDGTTGSGGGVVLATGPTLSNPVVGTQSAGDNSTKAASTAYALRAIYGISPTVPLSSNFSTFGANITVTDKSDRMQFSTTTSATIVNGITQNSISTPYTVDFAGSMIGVPASTGYLQYGLCLSDGTKFRTFMLFFINTTTTTISSIRLLVDAWTNSTTESGPVFNNDAPVYGNLVFLRITDDGANRKYWVSQNGKDYVQVLSEATNTGLTPTKFGICHVNNGLSPTISKVAIYHFLVTSSVLGDGS